MRIGIDCRLASAFGGLGRYTRELVVPLVQILSEENDVVLFVRDTNEEWLRPLQNMHSVQLIHAPYGMYTLSEQLLFPRAVRKATIDLLYAPHFTVPLFCPVPFVVTIHDLILHRYPNRASLMKKIAYRLLMRHAITRAKRIIAVSQFTATEILDVYGARHRSRLSVVSEGVPPQYQPRPQEEVLRVMQKYSLTHSYVLYVGNCKEHKNIDVLLRGFQRAQLQATTLVLVTGGKESFRYSFSDNMRVLRDVPEEDLPALYTGARALVTVSLYEGYCLPIAESQACGTPVIATKGSAILEIAQPGSLLIDPTEEALARALQSPPDRIASLKTPVHWENPAQDVSAILRSAL